MMIRKVRGMVGDKTKNIRILSPPNLVILLVLISFGYIYALFCFVDDKLSIGIEMSENGLKTSKNELRQSIPRYGELVLRHEGNQRTLSKGVCRSM